MRLCSADSLEARCWSAQKSGLASSSSSWRRRSFSGGTSKVTTGPVELGPDLLELLLQRLFSGLGHGGGMLAPPAEPALDRAQPRQRLRRVALPPAEPHRTREAVRRLLVDRRHDRAVDEQAVGALARELREQILGEPLAARRDAGLEVADEELDLEVAPRARDEARREHLMVLHADHLPVDGAELHRAERDLLDDALEAPRLDRDPVADLEPVLDEHEQAGDDVPEDALDREADDDRDERAAGDRVGVPHAAQDDDREHESEPERQVADARLRERGRRLALLEPRDRVRRRVLVDGPPRDEPRRDEARDARDDDRAEEEPDDEDELGQRPRQRDQVDEVAHAAVNLPATKLCARVPRFRPEANTGLPAAPLRRPRLVCSRIRLRRWFQLRPHSSPSHEYHEPDCDLDGK